MKGLLAGKVVSILCGGNSIPKGTEFLKEEEAF